MGGVAAELARRARSRRRASLDRRYDRKHGVDTSGIVEIREFVSDPEVAQHVVFYQPSPVGKLRAIFDRLSIPYDDFTFVDFGSGKGRVLLVAAEYPFRAVRGVEFIEQLHLAAERNIVASGKLELRCRDIRSICMDATQFPIPGGPVLCYFFTPFRGPILDRVLSNIVESVEADPRDAVVVYFGGDPVVRDRIDARLGWETSELELPHDPTIDAQRACYVHRRPAEG